MNVIGAKTLFMKEVRRFLRVPGQTVLQPLISTSLYFVVFAYTLGGRQSEVEGVPTFSTSCRAWCSWASRTTRS